MGAGLAWGSFAIGLVIVALAVGIPYFLTHGRMRDPHDVSDSRSYCVPGRREYAVADICGVAARNGGA
jgi:hypothetical protein